MARPKKTDEQKQLAPATHAHAVPSPGIPPAVAAPMNHSNKVIDVENFIRVRNSVRTFPRPHTIDWLFASHYSRHHHHHHHSNPPTTASTAPAPAPAPASLDYLHQQDSSREGIYNGCDARTSISRSTLLNYAPLSLRLIRIPHLQHFSQVSHEANDPIDTLLYHLCTRDPNPKHFT